MRTIQSLSAVILISIISSCASSEIGDIKDVNPETVYTNYEVFFEEGNDSVYVQAQFRFAGNKGTTLVLSNPSAILLDGEQMQLDSSAAMGAYYKLNKAVANFGGVHQFAFIGFNKKQYRNSFAFEPFNWGSNADFISKKGASLLIDGIKDGTVLDVEISDTSDATSDIDKKIMITEGKLVIPAADLQTLRNGPVSVNIYRNEVKKLSQSTPEGGTIQVSYALKKRTLSLQD